MINHITVQIMGVKVSKMGLMNQINASSILYSNYPIRSYLDGGRPFKYSHTAN